MDERENRNNGEVNRNKKHKKNFSISRYVWCETIGHRYLQCEKPWIAIPRGGEWTTKLKLVAINARERYEIKTIRFDNPKEAEEYEIAQAMRRLKVRGAQPRRD